MAKRRTVTRRRSHRLEGYDYASPGAYFVTICTQNNVHLFGQIESGVMLPNSAGEMLTSVWESLPIRFDHIILDEFVVMPNHFHGIVAIRDSQNQGGNNQNQGDHFENPGDHEDRPYGGDGLGCGTAEGSLGRVVQAFKSITTNEYISGVQNRNWPRFDGKLWQRDYYERVIRDDDELEEIREYIIRNPSLWKSD